MRKGAGLGTRVWVRAEHVWLQAECLWLQAKLVSIGWRGVAWRVAWCVVLRVAWRVASPPRAPLRTALHCTALHCTRPRSLLSPVHAPHPNLTPRPGPRPCSSFQPVYALSTALALTRCKVQEARRLMTAAV